MVARAMTYHYSTGLAFKWEPVEVQEETIGKCGIYRILKPKDI